jgi:hypothetical protein
MISDRPEREGFANLVRDLIEARELTADLVKPALQVLILKQKKQRHRPSSAPYPGRS